MIHLMLLNIAFFYFMCVTMMVCNVCANHCAAFISDNEIRFITVNCKLSLIRCNHTNTLQTNNVATISLTVKFWQPKLLFFTVKIKAYFLKCR